MRDDQKDLLYGMRAMVPYGLHPRHDMCKEGYELTGYIGYLCKICRKVFNGVNTAIRDLEKQAIEMANRMTVLEMEKETLAQKVERMEIKTDRVKEGLAQV